MTHKAKFEPCRALAFGAFASLIASLSILAQSGGQFSVTQPTIVPGSGSSSEGIYRVESTVGQPLAGGAVLRGGLFTITSGFWTFVPPGPTAAQVSISGRVITAAGRGITGAVVTLRAQDGSIRTVGSSSFGRYKFDEVAVGETYIVSVTAKRFSFVRPTIVLEISDQISDLDFVAEPFHIGRSP
jgi:hypothetical protein